MRRAWCDGPHALVLPPIVSVRSSSGPGDGRPAVMLAKNCAASSLRNTSRARPDFVTATCNVRRCAS
jgi:hypothetical protein